MLSGFSDGPVTQGSGVVHALVWVDAVGLIPGSGTSAYCRYGQKKKKKKSCCHTEISNSELL